MICLITSSSVEVPNSFSRVDLEAPSYWPWEPCLYKPGGLATAAAAGAAGTAGTAGYSCRPSNIWRGKGEGEGRHTCE